MPAAHVGFTSLAADPRFQVKGVCTPDSPFEEMLKEHVLEFSSFSMSAVEAEKFLVLLSNRAAPPPQDAPN